MRVGKNPAKLDENSKVQQDCFHQVIVPVHLPELKGYYKDGLEILKLCIESIYLTTHRKTFISVINNGSCDEVKFYLCKCLDEKKIHEVIHTSSIGKINAIAKGLAGHDFDLVTITDADVLFINDWQKAVYDIYNSFPKAGMVCTTLQPKRLKQYTENIYFDNLFNNNLKFRIIKSVEDLKRFSKSINNESLFKDVHLKKILSVEKNGTIAVLGAGHFSATFKRELLNHLIVSFSKDKLSSKSDKLFIDLPSVKYGHWRLSTYDNYTFHLGNQVENWMKDEVDQIAHNPNVNIEKPNCEFEAYKLVGLKTLFIQKVLFRKSMWRRFLKWKGLDTNETEIY